MIGHTLRDHRRSFAWLAGLVIITGVLFPASAVLAVPVEEEVVRQHDGDWHWRETSCEGNPTGNHLHEPGPVGLPGQDDDDTSPTPPGEDSTGSFAMTTGTNGQTVVQTRNSRYTNRLLSDLQVISYWTYVQPTDFPVPDEIPAIYFGLSLDLGGDGTYDDDLIFEPRLQEADNQQAVDYSRWQRWVARDSDTGTSLEGLWYREDERFTPGRVLKSLEAWGADFPLARLVPNTPDVANADQRGAVYLGAGCGEEWDGFDGNVDAIEVTFADPAFVYNSVVYDMEPDPGTSVSLDCNPEQPTPARTGESHVITCDAESNPGGAPADVRVDFEMTGANDVDGDTPKSPDFTCRTEADGACSITHGGSSTRSAGITTYTAWIDDDNSDGTVEADRAEGRDHGSDPGARPDTPDLDDTDVVEMRWSPSRLDCEPESAAPSPGSAHLIRCVATDVAGALVSGTRIRLEATGVNDPDSVPGNSLQSPDFTCDTGSDGSCTVTHGPGGVGTTTAQGRTTYRGWIDKDSSVTTQEADATEGLTHTTTPGSRSEIDDTDVVEANWGGTGATASPTPTQTSTPRCPTPTPTPTGSPTVSPSPTPTQTACPTPTPTRPPTPTPTPTPTRTPPVREPLTSGPCAGFFRNSRVERSGGGQVIVGTSGNDQINGSSGNDLICSLGGEDTIRALGGSDEVYSGRGEDTIRAGRGKDAASGGRHDDLILGAPGDDQLRGSAGRDDLRGGKGDDTLDGGSGRDSCDGDSGRDRLTRCE